MLVLGRLGECVFWGAIRRRSKVCVRKESEALHAAAAIRAFRANDEPLFLGIVRRPVALAGDQGVPVKNCAVEHLVKVAVTGRWSIHHWTSAEFESLRA